MGQTQNEALVIRYTVKCLICPYENLVVTKLKPEIQVASDVIKGHIQHLCLGHTACALPLLTKQQQIYFVSTLQLGTIDWFLPSSCFVGGVFWFSLDKCQVPAKTTLSLALLSWTGEKKYDERLEVEIRTVRDHSPITVMEKRH